MSYNDKEYVNKLDVLKAAEKKLAELKASQTQGTGDKVITPSGDKQETITQTSVQTGDNMNVIHYLITLCVTALGIMFFVRRKERK